MRHVVLDIPGWHEFSACGYAFDEGEFNPEAEGEFVDARPGLRVTCPRCCEAVRAMRATIRGLRLEEKRPAEAGPSEVSWDSIAE